jgi:hypothetical protein
MRRDRLDIGELRLEPAGVRAVRRARRNAAAASAAAALRGSRQPSTLR